MDIFIVFLFGPWASFNCAKVVVKYVNDNEFSFNILEVQVWGCKHVSMSHYLSYRSIEDSDYVHGTLLGFLSLMKD